MVRLQGGESQIRAFSSVASGNRQEYDAAVEASNKANAAYWNAMRPVISELQTSLQRYLMALNRFLQPDELPSIPDNIFISD